MMLKKKKNEAFICKMSHIINIKNAWTRNDASKVIRHGLYSLRPTKLIFPTHFYAKFLLPFQSIMMDFLLHHIILVYMLRSSWRIGCSNVYRSLPFFFPLYVFIFSPFYTILFRFIDGFSRIFHVIYWPQLTIYWLYFCIIYVISVKFFSLTNKMQMK